MRNLLWQSEAWDEYTELQSDKKMLRKVNKLLKDIMRNGYQCTYEKAEMLKGDFSGYCSIRIDQKNRIVFKADEVAVIIIKCGGHYHDK